MEGINDLFTDDKRLQLHFELPVKPGSMFILRIYSINRKNGSILDAWSEMSVDDEPSPEDLQYLERVAAPRMTRQNCGEKNGKLRFDTVLEPNEIQFIHATIKYA